MISLTIVVVALLGAWLLYRKSTSAYLSYTLWMWFLAPLVRRLVDWMYGWSDKSIILIAPLLVSCLAGLSLFKRSQAESRLPIPIVVCICGVLYGFCVGLFIHPSVEVLYGLLNWLSPLLVGIHVVLDWRNYPKNRDSLLTTCLWGAGLLGFYGIYQFIFAPPWDAYWLQNITSGLIDPSFGQPEPFLMRVWSTMNSPGTFSGCLVFILLICTVAKSPLKIPFSVAGYIALLLTVVRASWLGWLLGMVLLLRTGRALFVLRVFATVLLMALCIVPILEFSNWAPTVTDRLNTLTDLKRDESFRERSDMYNIVTDKILHTPFGNGLENGVVVSNLAVDSGILATLLSLGWLGTALYLGGVIIFLVQGGANPDAEPFISVCRAFCFAHVAQYIGANIFLGIGGIIFWMSAGFTIAAVYWKQSAAAHQAKPSETSQLDAPILATAT